MPPPSSRGPCLVVTDATRPPVPASGAAALPLLLGSTGPPCSRAARAWRADGEGPRTGCPPVCPLLPCMLHCPVSSRATHELKDSSGRLQRCRCDGRAGNQARRPGCPVGDPATVLFLFCFGISKVRGSFGSKKSALPWRGSLRLGGRVGFRGAPFKEHPCCPRQRGTVVVLWGPPSSSCFSHN